MPADKQDDEKQPTFKVSDRRSFAGAGDAPVESAASGPARAPAGAASGEVPPVATEAATDPGSSAGSFAEVNAIDDGSAALPAVDFHTFILSLGSSALLHLGELDRPDGQETKVDLPLAKQTIDMIGMLQEKTRGNLTPPEARLIESLLYDLRLRFVELNKK